MRQPVRRGSGGRCESFPVRSVDMTRMLVTGGAGFIGSNFVHYTLKQHPEYEICVLDSLTYAGHRESLAPAANNIEFVEGDICDVELVDRLMSRTDVVVHFAAESHVDRSLHDPEPFIRSNITGTSYARPQTLGNAFQALEEFVGVPLFEATTSTVARLRERFPTSAINLLVLSAASVPPALRHAISSATMLTAISGTVCEPML